MNNNISYNDNNGTSNNCASSASSMNTITTAVDKSNNIATAPNIHAVSKSTQKR